ncbi:hypothetical protein MCEMSEM29_01948 [Methylophilaceae bacterium]
MAFDVSQALVQGYSYTDIAIFLEQQQNFDIAGARTEGYTDTEIANHLAINYAGKNNIENVVKQYNSDHTVTSQQIDQVSKSLDTSSAYKDTAEVFIFVALLAGLVFYLIMPKKFKATTPFEMGRVWLGWLMAAAVLSAPSYYVKYGIGEAAGMFVATLIVVGPLALLIGWLYGKYFKFASKNSNIPINSDSANKVTKNNENSSANNSYLLALEEYDSNQRDKALWAKCFALSEGNETKTKALYVKERASTILRKYQPNSDNHINSLSNEMADLSISNNNNYLNIQNATRDIFIEGGINKSFYPSSDYSTASDKFLLKNRMFEVIKHKTIQIMLLKNGRAAVEVGDEIKVFENESRCKAARLKDKYPAGLMATIKLSDLDDDDAKKEKAAKKLNYKNFQELEDKVSKRIPVAMFDMANILLEHDVSSSVKQRALVLLESAAIHGHTEAKILWQHLRGESIKRQ